VTAIADDRVWPRQRARATPCSQPGLAGSERYRPLLKAGNGKVMNEIASFIDACVVVRLCHQSGISRRYFTVRNVRGTSSHCNYQTDLRDLCSLVGKTSSSNLSTTRSPFLIHELT